MNGIFVLTLLAFEFAVCASSLTAAANDRPNVLATLTRSVSLTFTIR